jgi:hypothetical protein
MKFELVRHDTMNEGRQGMDNMEEEDDHEEE